MLKSIKQLSAVPIAASFAAMGMVVQAMEISPPSEASMPTCVYASIQAKCGELIITSAFYGDSFEQAQASISGQVTQLGGKLLNADAELNRIIVHFPQTLDLTHIKQQLELLPEIHSVAYSPESVMDTFGG